MEKKFKIISCINKNMVIGNQGRLLYHIKSDMGFFKSTTINNVVIMGRNTYESLPRILAKRINIVISSTLDIKSDESLYVVRTIDEAVNLCKEKFAEMDWFVIGGGKIYDTFIELGLVSDILFTEVDDEQEGDAKITKFIADDWEMISEQQCFTSDFPFAYSFRHYVKKS